MAGIWNDLLESITSGREKGITNFPAVWNEMALSGIHISYQSCLTNI